MYTNLFQHLPQHSLPSTQASPYFNTTQPISTSHAGTQVIRQSYQIQLDITDMEGRLPIRPALKSQHKRARLAGGLEAADTARNADHETNFPVRIESNEQSKNSPSASIVTEC